MDLNLALPAYEMVLKAGHTFNLLDARGAISVTERAAYIGRIRQISRAVAQSYYDSRERLGFPMCQKKNKEVREMASLLIEIQTEELPPKALDNLSKAFAKELAFSLKEQDLALPNAQVTAYGSPRRIAALISDVSEVAPDKPFRQKLVPVKVGLDAEGKATPALSKKMKALGIECEPSELKVVNDGKQDQLVYEGTKAGVSLKDGLQIALDHAVRRLPIPKVMSYQLENGKTVEFVRPVKHLVALFDKEIVPVELFGLKAGRETMGHRFHVKEPISIKEAEKYAEQMEKEGKIVASFEERKNKMVGELKSAAEKLNAEIIMPDDLVNEVAALTEWPVVYESGFDEEF